jgi:hypothetical protein
MFLVGYRGNERPHPFLALACRSAARLAVLRKKPFVLLQIPNRYNTPRSHSNTFVYFAHKPLDKKLFLREGAEIQC